LARFPGVIVTTGPDGDGLGVAGGEAERLAFPAGAVVLAPVCWTAVEVLPVQPVTAATSAVATATGAATVESTRIALMQTLY
jgi:hypothetical protein